MARIVLLNEVGTYHGAVGDFIAAAGQLRGRPAYFVRAKANSYGDGEWVIVVRHEAIGRDDATVDTTVVAAGDLHLVRKAVPANTDSAVVVYENGRVTGWAPPPDEERRAIERRIDHPVLTDDGILPWLFTLLPLAEDYRATIETFGTWDGELHAVTYRVIGSEQFEHRGRTVDCWVVTSDRLEPYGIHSRALVEKSSRRYIRGDAWSDDGTRYVSEVR